MAEPMIAGRGPMGVDVVAGRTYWWCRCGRSATQPFCDGSHKGSEFSPIQFDAQATAKVWFCVCKHSGKAPLCDGTHKTLS